MTMTCEKYKVTHADYHELQRKQQEYPINIKKAAMTVITMKPRHAAFPL